MVWIGGLVVIRLMTRNTLCWCSFKPISMASQAIDNRVRTGEWKVCTVVIKHPLRIPGGMTGQTKCTVIRISSYSLVLVIRFRVGVASDAGENRKIIGVGVTIHALIPNPLVISAINWEILCIMIEIGRDPSVFSVT